jgi:hypothetical protein
MKLAYQSTSYAISVPRGTVHWCIDSHKTKKEIPVALTSGELVCP